MMKSGSGLNTDEILLKFSKKEQEEIEKKSNILVVEMIQHAESLKELRQASLRTQVEVAKSLGIGQVAVARLEGRSDILVSTLRRYLGALGAELQLIVKTKNGVEIRLDNLSDVFEKTNKTIKSNVIPSRKPKSSMIKKNNIKIKEKKSTDILESA